MRYYPMLVMAACALLAGCGDSEPGGQAPAPPERDTRATAAPKSDSPPSAAVEAVSHPLPGDPEAGKEVYMRICVACHQADGSGLNGMLAANFVGDASRLAKPNEVLLSSIRNGIIADNKVMPPQKDVLSDQEMKDALSYIRKTFGSKSTP